MYQQTITTGGSTAAFNTFNSQPQPTAHITKSRGRLKAYGQSVYLKDGSHFEIELYNPKTAPVLAKIWINGKPLSESGLILKPGQRVYLERFLDVSKKFLFETYDVDRSTGTVRAIANNGKVEVLFYDEMSITSSSTWQNPWFGTVPPPAYYGNPTVTISTTPIYSTNTAFFNTSAGIHGSNGPAGPIGADMQETGRVEMGESSGQEIISGFGSFNSWTCSKSEWQILPESKKPVEMGEIRSYCTGCGTRHKKSSWKFCPNCGTPVSE